MTRALTIAVDIDETIADLMGPWLRRYNFHYGDSLLPENITDWGLKRFLKEECGDKIYDLLDHTIYEEILPLPCARTAINVLRYLGHRIIFVTSCTRNTTDAKLRWLCRYGFLDKTKRFQPDFFAASDKSMIRADVLIDDALHNVESFPGMAWLISQPQNAFAITNRPRLKSIAEAPEAISRWLAESPYADAA